NVFLRFIYRKTKLARLGLPLGSSPQGAPYNCRETTYGVLIFQAIRLDRLNAASAAIAVGWGPQGHTPAGWFRSSSCKMIRDSLRRLYKVSAIDASDIFAATPVSRADNARAKIRRGPA